MLLVFCFTFLFVFGALFDWLGGMAAFADARKIMAYIVLPVFFAVSLAAGVKFARWQHRRFAAKSAAFKLLVFIAFLLGLVQLLVNQGFI